MCLLTVLPPVVKLLQHRHAMVREKAVYCVHAFFRRAPGLMGHTLPQLKGMLGDKDPGVLSAVVTLLSLLVETSRAEFVSFGVDLINVLQQVNVRLCCLVVDVAEVATGLCCWEWLLES